MLELDGSEIKIGDSVYDIANGYGAVAEIRDRFFTVQFLNRRRITFKDNGMLNGMRRVFWHNPLVIAPPKSEARWDSFKLLIVSIKQLTENS